MNDDLCKDQFCLLLFSLISKEREGNTEGRKVNNIFVFSLLMGCAVSVDQPVLQSKKASQSSSTQRRTPQSDGDEGGSQRTRPQGRATLDSNPSPIISISEASSTAVSRSAHNQYRGTRPPTPSTSSNSSAVRTKPTASPRTTNITATVLPLIESFSSSSRSPASSPSFHPVVPPVADSGLLCSNSSFTTMGSLTGSVNAVATNNSTTATRRPHPGRGKGGSVEPILLSPPSTPRLTTTACVSTGPTSPRFASITNPTASSSLGMLRPMTSNTSATTVSFLPAAVVLSDVDDDDDYDDKMIQQRIREAFGELEAAPSSPPPPARLVTTTQGSSGSNYCTTTPTTPSNPFVFPSVAAPSTATGMSTIPVRFMTMSTTPTTTTSPANTVAIAEATTTTSAGVGVSITTGTEDESFTAPPPRTFSFVTTPTSPFASNRGDAQGAEMLFSTLSTSVVSLEPLTPAQLPHFAQLAQPRKK